MLSDRKTHMHQVLKNNGFFLTDQEAENIEIADFGLNDFETTGLYLYTYENNHRYCAKELYLAPGQTCPEHRHPPVNGQDGKMETFRCRKGIVYLYVEGDATPSISATLPAGREATYSAFHQVILLPGEQYTIAQDTKHWFQAGPEGAIVSEFSSTSSDENDIFTDPEITR